MSFRLESEKEYFRNKGVDVMAFSDNYPEGHQSGISIIMHDRRIATNGDVRFEPTPGQWQPVPRLVKREVLSGEQAIRTELSYPDEATHLKGFNPRIYPDFRFSYTVTCTAEGDSVVVTVDLDREIPDEFAGKLCFNLELFPGALFGKSYIMDDCSGVFPRQPYGPCLTVPSNRDRLLPAGSEGILADPQALCGSEAYSPMVADDIICAPYAVGHHFTLCPEDDLQRICVRSDDCELRLYDGRFNHNNGWFVLSSPLPQGRTAHALRWVITPNAVQGFLRQPVIQISNVGYHPMQPKTAVIELDEKDIPKEKATLYILTPAGRSPAKELEAVSWGSFLRYRYLVCDFSDVRAEGMYYIEYGDARSSVFRISDNVYRRGVWQPVMEYFLPVQMCHMRVNEKYRVWHGHCHNDDARMAPVGRVHFDGYVQGSETLTRYAPGDCVPGLNAGGWHDAGDFDLRVESQSGEAYILSMICEEFGADYDATTIDQTRKLVEIHQPDGVNDFMQQIEHGLLSVLGGYKALGRLYRGIICGDLRQYALLGDGAAMTDGIAGNDDDRWVFTENNPVRELNTAAHLAACSRVIRDYNPDMADDALSVAAELYRASAAGYTHGELALLLFRSDSEETRVKAVQEVGKAGVHAAAELFLTTRDSRYLDDIVSRKDVILADMNATAHVVARVFEHISDCRFRDGFIAGLKQLSENIADMSRETPYGLPYRPYIWGAGWMIQSMAVRYYFLHKHFPDIFDSRLIYNSLSFILGTHPGSNNASFVSGVGARSMLTAYGINRADWSYIPGGVVSGTALIRPDFPELLEFPYLWQQAEYVLGGGSSNYMFLVFAVEEMIRNNDFPAGS